MGSFGFLVSRRWVLFAVAVVGIGYASWWLGGWQFGRLHDRRADNAVVRTNEAVAPTPVGDVLPVGAPASRAEQWRIVTATGTYDADQTVVVRYQTRDGQSGVDLVVPLVTDDGAALLVDRGWLSVPNPDSVDPAEIPPPPAGEVTVTGWVRTDGAGSSTRVDALSTRAISSSAIGAAIDRPVYGGFVDLRTEDGSPAPTLGAAELPELNSGPHFFYGLQWWFFGVLAIFGFFYLLYDEWRRGPRSARSPAAGEVGSKPADGFVAAGAQEGASMLTPVGVGPAQRAATPDTAAESSTGSAAPRRSSERAQARSEAVARRSRRRAATEAGLVKARAEKAARVQASRADGDRR